MQKYFSEIKNRILLVFFSWTITLLVAYSYRETCFYLVFAPSKFDDNISLTINSFVCTDVRETFFAYTSLTLIIGNTVGSFFILYHTLVFITPALFKYEFVFINNSLKFIFFLSIFSIVIVNNIFIPYYLNFFFIFYKSHFICLQFEAKLSEFISVYLSLYKQFIVIFNLFAVLIFCIVNFKITIQRIKNSRKLFYYIFLVVICIVFSIDLLSLLVIILVVLLLTEFIFFFKLLKKSF